ncbi:MAG: hypothetical protein JWQ11_2904 [Rhizobacter sp.]|nr:hypothetical protein [Rhizobacter sp.]
MKTSYLAQWEKLKKDFDTVAKGLHQPNASTLTFLASMAKPTGLTPILKEIDAAFDKEHRKTVNELLLKFYGKREPTSLLLSRTVPHLDGPLQSAAIDLSSQIVTLEKSIQQKMKELQDGKAGAKGASDWNLSLLFETDLKKNIEQLTKDLKPSPLAAIEKKRGVLKLPAIAVKHMDAYSKAAARLKADEAFASLKDFVKAADKCTRDAEAAIKTETDGNYKKPVERFIRDLRTLCSARVDVQMKKLDAHLKI